LEPAPLPHLAPAIVNLSAIPTSEDPQDSIVNLTLNHHSPSNLGSGKKKGIPQQPNYNVILAHIQKRQKTLRNQTLWQHLLRNDDHSSIEERSLSKGKKQSSKDL